MLRLTQSQQRRIFLCETIKYAAAINIMFVFIRAEVVEEMPTKSHTLKTCVYMGAQLWQ